MYTKNRPFILRSLGMLMLLSLLIGCHVQRTKEYDQRQTVTASSAICDAAGVAAPCVRVTNSSQHDIDELRLGFASESIQIGNLAANSTSAYQTASRGVYSYSAFGYVIDGEEQVQPVTDFVGEAPLKGGAFTFVLGYDPNLRYPVQRIKVTEDDSGIVLYQLAAATPLPEMHSASPNYADNTIDCFTAQELAEAVFRSYQHKQRAGGDAPYIDEQGILHLHTTANEFAGDTGHRLLVHDAPVGSDEINLGHPVFLPLGFERPPNPRWTDMISFGYIHNSNKVLNLSVAELAGRFVDRTCENDRSTLPGIDVEIANAPLLGAADLAAYQWKNRVLLIFEPMSIEGEFINMMLAYRKSESLNMMLAYEGLHHELVDRDLLWFHLLVGEPAYVDEGFRPIARLSREFSSALTATYNPNSDPFRIVLIGKDGGVKHTTTELLSPADLFSIIDAMPMRQQEMKDK